MAYLYSGDETEDQKQKRFAGERARRELRKQQRALRDQEKKELGKVSGSKDRRRVQEEFKEDQDELQSTFEGGVYDVETGEYKFDFNKQGTDETIANDGIDQLEDFDEDEGSDSNVEFNGSVIICINGSPFYIDIPYNPTTGVYPESGGANFPITAP